MVVLVVKIFVYLCVINMLELDSRPYLNSTESVMLNELCPNVDICDENSTNASPRPNLIIKGGFISCCTGCSCHPNCKEKLSCCYPDENAEGKSQTIQHCLPTRIGKPADHFYTLVPAYFTVTLEPRGGCKDQTPFGNNANGLIVPSCKETNGTISDSYFPVYSETRREIYKTLMCAKCHGVKDARPFTPALVCVKRLTSMSERLNFFETGRLSKNCHIDFVYDDPADLSSRRCYRNVVKTCLTNNIRYPKGVQLSAMDIESVKSLCETSVYSPFVNYYIPYRNVFCYMCSQPGSTIETGYMLCLADKETKVSFKAITTLIDPRLFYSHKISSNNGKYPEACLYNTITKDVVSCRHLYCPSGQIRHPVAKCHYVTTHWRGVTQINIKLTVLNLEMESVIKYVQTASILEIERVLRENSPWSSDWKTIGIGRKVGVTENDSCNRDIFILMHESAVEKSKDIIRQIKRSLADYWQINLNGTKVAFGQSLLKSKFTRLSNVAPSTFIFKLAENLLDCNKTLWSMVIVKPSASTSTLSFLKKLTLCQQVQLHWSEFKLGLTEQYIESNLTKRILYDNEFDLIHDEERTYARVCLSDTILQAKTASPGTRLGSLSLAKGILPITVCLVLFAETHF